MDFEYRETISYPLERVYTIFRDEMPAVVGYLPSVASIELVSRDEEAPGRIRLVNRWQGASASVPRVARPFVTASMGGWRDDALWFDDEAKVEWTFETEHFGKLYDCAGTNSFHDVEGDATEVVLKGYIKVYPDRVPGVPRILARRVGPQVEKVLIDMVTPNLRELPRAVQAYLDSL